MTLLALELDDDVLREGAAHSVGSIGRTSSPAPPARNNVAMSAGKLSCPDIICYLLSIITTLFRDTG